MTRAVLALALASCLETPPLVRAEPEVGKVEIKDMAIPGVPRIDVLFVIDGSPAMRAHRANLDANTPNFMNVFHTLEGGLPSIHVAVVTTDLGTSAHDGVAGPELVGDGGCRGSGDGARFRATNAIAGQYIEDRLLADRSRIRNYTGALPDVFQELARVGDAGCAFSQPLEAMRRGLLEPEDAGFLRDDAFLAVIFVTAQDDCSFQRSGFLAGATGTSIDTTRCYTRSDELVATDTYVQFVKSLKADTSRIIVSSVMGPDEPLAFEVVDGRLQVRPSCSFDGASALPSPRLQRFLDQFPNRTSSTSICQQDLSGGLYLFTGPGPRIGDPCINGTLADVDPITPGRQEDCVAWYSFPVTGAPDELFARCESEITAPCWDLVTDPLKCPAGANEIFVVKHEALELPDETHVHIQCVTQ